MKGDRQRQLHPTGDDAQDYETCGNPYYNGNSGTSSQSQDVDWLGEYAASYRPIQHQTENGEWTEELLLGWGDIEPFPLGIVLLYPLLELLSREGLQMSVPRWYSLFLS